MSIFNPSPAYNGLQKSGLFDRSEDKRLKLLRGEQISWKEISRVMGRTVASLKKHLTYMRRVHPFL